MGFPEAKYIWKEGEFIAWQDATVHILSIAVQFGSSVFEGIRCYETPQGPAIFRLPEHLRRLEDSCKVYRFDIPWTRPQLTEAARELVRRNELGSCYVRPMVLRGYGSPGFNPIGLGCDTWIAAWPWGTYLGEEALREGVDVCVSSWHRAPGNTYPSLAKSAGHYNNGQLMKAEATVNGYAEAIALGTDGLVSEGTGMNLFLVRDGVLYTPPIDGSILQGITRDSVLTLAREMGVTCREQPMPREMLYSADELFFTGTAAEVCPIRSVDKITVGRGRAGELTLQIQKAYMDIATGKVDDRFGWRTPVR